MESHAYILDYLPNGRQTERGFHREPLALAVGEDELKLLELVPKPGAKLGVGQRIPLVAEPGSLPPIDHVRRRIVIKRRRIALTAGQDVLAIPAAVRRL